MAISPRIDHMPSWARHVECSKWTWRYVFHLILRIQHLQILTLTFATGAGLIESGPANIANVSLYSTFAAMGFISGIFVNKLGPRVCLVVGGVGYATYTASLLSYKHNANEGFVIFAGLLLGVCAGVFWAAQVC